MIVILLYYFWSRRINISSYFYCLSIHTIKDDSSSTSYSLGDGGGGGSTTGQFVAAAVLTEYSLFDYSIQYSFAPVP